MWLSCGTPTPSFTPVRITCPPSSKTQTRRLPASRPQATRSLRSSGSAEFHLVSSMIALFRYVAARRGLQPERGGEQRTRVVGLRIFVQLRSRPLLDHLAVAHHAQMARKRGHD